ncbi:MAG TPA: GAF domain-containing protein, partial [Anaerolineales bacterium]|nr:GAF domain-containing protein [Anaerolineales bacterium]
EKHILDQASDSLFQYDRWRISFLNTILRVAVALGFGLFLVNIPAFRGSEFVIFSVAYIVLLIVTFAPLSYSIKAGTLIMIGYFVGTYTLIQYGPWAGAAMYYLVITLFASLLFDERIDRWVFAVNVITIFTFSILNLQGRFTLGVTEFPTPTLTDWISYSADYIVFAIAIAWAINLLKNEFKSIADQFQSALTFLSKDRSELETRVKERTAGLIKKTEQLRAASYITRQTAEVQDLETVLNLIVNLLTEQFGFYHVGILLMNEAGDEIILQATSSDGGRRMMEKGYSVKVGSRSIVSLSVSEKKPRIALDVGTDPVSFDNPDLPNTHSQMALPLLVHDKVIGILDIQSDQTQAFSVDDIDVLQTLTDQIAIAIDNMRLLEDAQTALTQVEALTTIRTREAWNQKAKDGNYTYTYTPLGMRPGKASEESDQIVKVPITLRGQNIGTISLARKNKTEWSEVDIDMVKEVAYQAGLAVDNVRLVEEATERAQQEQTVGELAARFSQSADIDSLLQTAARELGQVADVAEVSVYIGEIPEQSPQKKRVKRASA